MKEKTNTTVAVVTGTRAEYGLLKPVMQSIESKDNLVLKVIVTGTHLLSPSRTIDEVALDFEIAATIEMQQNHDNGRIADAVAMGRGITGLASAFDQLDPDVVLILGDRIEAFAAASAASGHARSPPPTASPVEPPAGPLERRKGCRCPIHSTPVGRTPRGTCGRGRSSTWWLSPG